MGLSDPALVAAAFDAEAGEERVWAVQVIADDSPDYTIMKANERRALETLGEVITLTRQDLASKALKRRIMGDMGQAPQD